MMKKSIRKLLCHPINWFVQKDELYSLPVIHFISAYVSILLILINAALMLLVSVCFLVMAYLYCATGQWLLAIKSMFLFITANACCWWAFKNKNRICGFINKRNVEGKSKK